ncbi:MAG: PKD domain-containing protein, partial [Pseudomonadota bacterium]|nr:PKD domain-containing protein [Pseudomonadota bacterium]
YPENNNNLGAAMLNNGAITTVSASRVSWYAVTSWYTGLKYYCDNASIGYYYGEELVVNEKPAAVALYDVKSDMGANQRINWGGSHWMNLFDFNLYGDPALSLLEYDQGAPPVTPPVADFTADPTSGAPLLLVTFTDISTNDPTSWLWNFGDGNTSSEQNPAHLYTNQGTYTVTLTACNAGGCSDSEVKIDFVDCTSVCGNDHIKVNENYYATSLQEVYNNNLTPDATLQAHATNFTENLTLDLAKTVNIVGGYDCSYANNEMATTLNGILTINSGTLTISNLVIQ